MQELILLVGNVGAGKTTLAKKLTDENTTYISLDDIGKNHSLNDRASWEKFEDELRKLFIPALDEGRRIIIDGNLMSKHDRKYYLQYTTNKLYRLICYDFGAGTEQQLLNRIKNSPELPEEVWKGQFNYKFDIYERPMLDEGFDEIILK